MYPNQGGGYPSAPFGSGMPPMPQPGMPQPFGNGFGAPQQPQGAPYGYPPQPMNPYQQPNQQMPGYPPASPMSAYPSGPQHQQPNHQMPGYPPQGPAASPMSAYPAVPQHQQQQQFPPQGGMYPQVPSFGSPMPMGAQPQQQGYGYQTPPQHQHAPIHQQYATPSYGQLPPTAMKKGRPTVVPFPNFDASNDAALLRKAMKGFGTDEDALINVLCRRTCAQRVEIVRAYKTAYGKDLISDIKSETSGNFERLLVTLCASTVELYCNELYEAMSGAGTDEDVLIEVMCTMTNAEIRQIGATYYRMFGQSLEQSLRQDTSGSVKRLMTSLSVGGRDESMITNVESARADAQSLQKAGVGRWGTDESEFNRILCLKNYEQLKLICEEYQKLTGSTLEKDIKKEFSGDIEDALLSIIRVAINRPEFFARRLHKSMAGMGTNDRSLIRLVVTRSEIDMMDIKDEFQRYYSKTLKSFIKGDTSGHYKHGLYALCGETRDK